MTEPGSELGARGDVSSLMGENKKQIYKNLQESRVGSQVVLAASLNRLCLAWIFALNSTFDCKKNEFRRQNVKKEIKTFNL